MTINGTAKPKTNVSGPDPDKQDPSPDDIPNPGDPGPEVPRPAEPTDPVAEGKIPPQNMPVRGV